MRAPASRSVSSQTVAPVVLRLVGLEQGDFHLTRLGLKELPGLRRLDESVAGERPASRLITRADPQRKLVDRTRSPKIGNGPALTSRMPSDEPARHHELDRECVGLNLLKVTGRLRLQRHPSQNAFVIETGLMLQAEVAELMSCSEPLNAHRTLRRHEDTGPRIVQISTEEPLQRPHKQGQIQGMYGREDIYVPAGRLDLLTQAKLLM